MSATEREISFGRALNEALREEMQRDSRVFVLGEDVGRLGGLFKVTDGLLQEFGSDRVIDTPISEAAIAGAGLGARFGRIAPGNRVSVRRFHDHSNGSGCKSCGEDSLHDRWTGVSTDGHSCSHLRWREPWSAALTVARGMVCSHPGA